MKNRKLSPSGDYVFGNNNQDYVEGSTAVAIAIKTKILLFYGEWWEDLGTGIPMFQSIIGQVNKESIKNSLQMLLIDRIKEVPEVSSVNLVSISVVDRTISTEINVTTTSGEQAEVEVVF